MVTPGMATTPLKLAAASVAQQERGLLSSSPRHAQHAHSPSPAGSASTEYSKKPCEQQQPSSAVRRGVRGANCGGGSHVHHLPSGVPRVIPTHDSVFFPKGTEVVAPVQLHYLTIAGWSTTAGGRDYFNHRRLRGGEIAGHTVLWLHTAKPRDQFVFLVTPVLNRGEAVPEDRTTTKAEQTQRCGPSIVAGASWTSSGGEGGAATRSELGVVSSGGSAEIHRTSRSNARMLKRWRWNKPSALLQALRTRIFGEAPWFTYRDTAAGARIRDAQVNNTHTRSAADAATVIGSNLGDLSTYNDSDIDNDGMESSSDGDTRRHHLGSPVGGADTAVSVVPPTNTDGVEAVVVAHADVTAMDYAPRLTSHRLSIEATAARTWFFPLLSDALAYYQCEEAVELIENQWSAGVTNQVPRPRAANQRYRQRRLQQSNDVSASGRGSLDRSSSVVTVPSTFPGEALLHEDGSPSSQSPSSPWMLPTTTTDTKWGREAAHNITTTGVDLAGAAGRVDRSHLSQPLSLSDALRNFKSMGNVRCGGASQSSAATATSLTAAAKNLRTQPCQHQRNSDPYRSPRTNPTVPKSCSSARDSCRRNPCNNGTTAKSPRTSPCNAADDARVTPVAEAANNPIIDHTSQPQRCHPAAPVQPRLTSSHGEVVISVYTADPVFNSVLRELLVPEPGTHPYTSNVTVQKRLLSMVEVGMPTWSILYSSTGLPYRRLFRLFYSCLTNLWPLLSLAVGLYDLYKHLPQLKRFMEHTLEPLTRWVEQRFTIRVSVLVTYLISVVVTIFGSLGSFVSQTYIVQLFYLPIVQFVLALLKLPLMIVFDTVWTLATTILGIVNVVLQVVRIVVMAPLVLVMNVASLRDAFGTALPAAAEGTSLSVKWWRSWIEFWETVASPTKNAARAWWDSMMHVSTSAARREMSIRRWYSPKLEQLAIVMEELQECIFINAQLWWSYFLLPGIKCKVLLIVVLVYLYWLFLGISPDLWDEVIHASGVRLHSPLRKKQLTSPVSTTDAPAPLSPPFPSTAPAYFYAVAHCKNDTIDACYSERNVSVSPKCANLDSSMCASLHDLPRDSGNGSSAPSAGAQPSSTVSTVKYASPTRTSGKNALTLRPESQQTFSALVAELLLPEVVLVFLHHLRGALVRGWTVAAAVTSHITAQHAKVIQINRHSETFVNTSADQTASPQCSWAETLATAYFGKHCAADAAVTTDASRHGSRVKRYINPTIVHVRWDGDEPFADPHALLRIWQAANAAKWGSVVGRETPLASPVVVLEEEPQHEAT
ncbi:hypothetical protein JKF63_06089 [Porcisia hertigi]|uniref:Transmembrane protein n=1 Tax=Porcisia hertigi TaxID=2761500 RepID=A0A836IWM9_9TRYP|nr:hypothetical protein JKF63_06089 [Porcisia hertigi]